MSLIIPITSNEILKIKKDNFIVNSNHISKNNYDENFIKEKNKVKILINLSNSTNINLRNILMESNKIIYNEKIIEMGNYLKKNIEFDYIEDYLLFENFYYNDKINLRDIKLGFIKSSSNFIAVIISLISIPQNIYKLFYIANKNKNNIYSIWINQCGIWKNYIIDNLLPFIENDQFFCTHLQDSKQIWLPLLEKAYSLAYYSWNKMQQILVEEMLYDLTGAPV